MQRLQLSIFVQAAGSGIPEVKTILSGTYEALFMLTMLYDVLLLKVLLSTDTLEAVRFSQSV